MGMVDLKSITGEPYLHEILKKTIGCSDCFAGKIPELRIVFLPTEGLTSLSSALYLHHRNRGEEASRSRL
jgi:hypothetical protein